MTTTRVTPTARKAISTDLLGIVSGERHRTHEQIADNTARASTVFDAAGVGSGDAVVLMLRNDFAVIEASFAAGALGAYPVPLNWHYKGDEVTHVLVDRSGVAGARRAATPF